MIFPTFEEIKQGYHIYDMRGKFKGLDENFEPKFSKPLKQEVEIAHGLYNRYIKIEIILNKKYKPIGFRCGYDQKFYSCVFPYTKTGYEKLLEYIKGILEYDKRQIESLLKELQNG